MAICPQRIITEAIDIIETQIDFDNLTDDVADRIDNNLQELQALLTQLPQKI